MGENSPADLNTRQGERLNGWQVLILLLSIYVLGAWHANVRS